MIAHADTYKFSVENFERLAETGMFDAKDRVELLDGEIIVMAQRENATPTPFAA